MDEPLDEQYFIWLYSQVGDSEEKDPTRTYWRMLKIFFKKEFVWIIPNDDNRIEDGKELRYEFVDQSGLTSVSMEWINLGCSMLELMIGLSRRLAFEAEGEPQDWFWHLINNLGLLDLCDTYPFNDRDVEDVLDRVIWRTYRHDGKGGLFPLFRPAPDQRSIELWYQLSAYLIQNEQVA